MSDFFPTVQEYQFPIEETSAPSSGIVRQKKTLHYDFQNQTFIRDDNNNFMKYDDYNKIRTWIQKVTLTQKEVWDLYLKTGIDTGFSTNFYGILEENISESLKKTKLANETYNSIIKHPEILDVTNIIVSVAGNGTDVTISYTVVLDETSFQGDIILP